MQWTLINYQEYYCKLQPTQTHATGTCELGPVLSANLKRKMRFWWAAAGLVLRRPVVDCRAEKILRAQTETWKRRERKQERQKKKKRHDSWLVNKRVGCPLLQALYGHRLKALQFEYTLWHHLDRQKLVSLTENTFNLKEFKCVPFVLSFSVRVTLQRRQNLPTVSPRLILF